MAAPRPWRLVASLSRPCNTRIASHLRQRNHFQSPRSHPQRPAVSSRKSQFSTLASSLRAEAPSPSPRAEPSSSSPPAEDPTALLSSQTHTLPGQSINVQEDDPAHIDWSRSFHGLSVEPFSKDAAEILLAPVNPDDVEIKPDGIIYLPEIKYRRILNKAFGPGGWGLAPRGETIVTDRAVTREYALLAHGR